MRNKSKRVSIILPIKDNIESVLACIKSFSSQTVKPREIIVVGSKNDLNLINQQIEKYERKIVKLIPFDGGKNEAKNRGFLKATGDFVISADNDVRASPDSIEFCLKLADNYDALYVAERGMGGNFWENTRALEREIIGTDSNTAAPYFFRRDIYKKGELPYDSRFGLLDEWGFTCKLKSKNLRIGVANTYFYIKEDNLTPLKIIKKKFARGMYFRQFMAIDKDEAWRRINPIERGIKFYGSRMYFLKKEPLLFSGLLLLKFVDFISFFAGYFVSFIIHPGSSKSVNLEEQALRVHDAIGGEYLKKMYQEGKWTEYVNEEEKRKVAEIWKLNNNHNLKKETILDLGVGPGRWANFFLKYGFRKVVGIDVAPSMINYARETIKNKRFNVFLGSMDNLPFKSYIFDKVFCFRAFKYSENPKQVIKEVERVLKSKGEFLLEVSNKSLANISLKKVSGIVLFFFPRLPLENRWRYYNKVNFYSKQDIQRLIRKTSLRMYNFKPLFILPSVPLPSLVDFVFSPFFRFLNQLLIKVLPQKRFARSWLILLRKI